MHAAAVGMAGMGAASTESPGPRLPAVHPHGAEGRFQSGFSVRDHIVCLGQRKHVVSHQEPTGGGRVPGQGEVKLGRVVGPMEVADLPGVHTNRLGLIEKPHQPGKFRLIVDLFYPEGHSVNDMT